MTTDEHTSRTTGIAAFAFFSLLGILPLINILWAIVWPTDVSMDMPFALAQLSCLIWGVVLLSFAIAKS